MRIFYWCQSSGACVESKNPVVAQTEELASLAQQMLRQEADHFGMIDEQDTTLQFRHENGEIWMEIPAPQERGSYGRVLPLEDLPSIIASVKVPFRKEDLDLTFQPW